VTVRGVVESFDDHRGYGEVRSDGGERLFFHSVSISDGSRTIKVGTRIIGQRRTGHLGRDELRAIGPEA
jgi:cold shock CspA family protein